MKLHANAPLGPKGRRRMVLLVLEQREDGAIGSSGREGRHRNPTRRDGSGVRRAKVGRECVHVCVDDATRLAYVEVLPDERARTAIGFLRRALAFYRSHGIEVERLMTDNGPAYVSAAHALACRAMGIRHLRTYA